MPLLKKHLDVLLLQGEPGPSGPPGSPGEDGERVMQKKNIFLFYQFLFPAFSFFRYFKRPGGTKARI